MTGNLERVAVHLLTAWCCFAEMVQGQDEGEGEQSGSVRPGKFATFQASKITAVHVSVV